MLTTKQKGKRQRIALDKLVLDRAYYPRVQDDWVTVWKYRDAMASGEEFPPIHVVPDGHGSFVVLDGWHRIQAAKKLKLEGFDALVYTRLPQEKWLALAVELNKANARPLTKQDRVMVASRLKDAGYDIAAIANLIAATSETIGKWLTGSIVEDDAGDKHAIKSAMQPLIGTANEEAAFKHDGPIANADVRRTLDELTALLRAKVVDVSIPAIWDKAVEIHNRLGRLLKKGKRAA